MNYLHCSEVSRWPGDAAAALAACAAPLAPGGEVVLESTPNGAYGASTRSGRKQSNAARCGHFFPWWIEPAYRSKAASDLSPPELELMERHGLTAEQIGFDASWRADIGRCGLRTSRRTRRAASAQRASAALRSRWWSDG